MVRTRQCGRNRRPQIDDPSVDSITEQQSSSINSTAESATTSSGSKTLKVGKAKKKKDSVVNVMPSNFLGSFESRIVDLVQFNGTVCRGEIVLLRREMTEAEKNGFSVHNALGVQIGRLDRECCFLLASLVDDKKIKLYCKAPCNKGTFSMPIDVNVYALEAHYVPEVKETFEKFRTIKLNAHNDIFANDANGITCCKLADLANAASQFSDNSTQDLMFDSQDEVLTVTQMANHLDQVFISLRATDKTEYREPPKHINKEIFPHQKAALAWMYKQENGDLLPPFWVKRGIRYVNSLTNFTTLYKPEPIRGGILADDMGLGKTIQMICLILSSFHDGKEYPVRVSNKRLCKTDDLMHFPSQPILSSMNNVQSSDYPRSLSETSAISEKKPKLIAAALLSDLEGCSKTLNGQTQNVGKNPISWSFLDNDDDDDYDLCVPFSTQNFTANVPKIKEPDVKVNECLDSFSTKVTLIVCPLSVISNWVDQLFDHLNSNVVLSINQYYGNKRMTISELQQQDIVITTYCTLASCFKKIRDPLFEMRWFRVILDEGHVIRNPRSLLSQACCHLKAERRWILTGTPIQNRLLDLWSLVKFLRVSPLDDRGYWRILFEKPITRRTHQGFERLKIFMQNLAMRRTKDQMINGKPLVQLPSKTIVLKTLTFSDDERKLYDVMYKEGKLVVNKFIREGTVLHHYAQVLAILLRLRQLCCHPFLVRQAAERAKRLGLAVKLLDNGVEDTEANQQLIDLLLEVLKSGSDECCPVCLDSLQEPIITKCAHVFCRPCISQLFEANQKIAPCPLCRREIMEENFISVPEEKLNPSNDDSARSSEDQWHSSVKVDALMAQLIVVRRNEPNAKSLVISQFTSFLDIIEKALLRENFRFVRLDGSMSKNSRIDVVKALNCQKAGSPAIMLLSMKAGGVGLNLMAANHVFLMEPAWNPAVEEQCFDRCHRLGQTKPVFVTKFVIQNSVEQRMLELQEHKRNLMTQSFSLDKVASSQRRIEDICRLMS